MRMTQYLGASSLILVLASCVTSPHEARMELGKRGLALCVLICLGLAFGLAQAEEIVTSEPPFLPATTTLSEEELRPLLEKWDEVMNSDMYLSEKYNALPLISQTIPKNMRFHGESVLRYDNPEIVDRVVDLYLNRAKYSKKGPEPGEGLYHISIASWAESTMDPRIYDHVMFRSALATTVRSLYLATTNPEQTLTYLFESKCGERTGGPRPGHRDYFYHGSVTWGMSVDGAYTLLSLMTTQSPDILRKHSGQVMGFVAAHIDHYREPRPRSYKNELVYMRHDDYKVRDGALDVLELLGTVENIELVQDIMHEVPEMGPDRLATKPGRERSELIIEKAGRVLETLQQRIPVPLGQTFRP